MSWANTNKKRVVGHVVDFCNRCADKLPLFKYKGQWLCADCKKVYKRQLASPKDTLEGSKERSDFHNWVDNAGENAHTRPFGSDTTI